MTRTTGPTTRPADRHVDSGRVASPLAAGWTATPNRVVDCDLKSPLAQDNRRVRRSTSAPRSAGAAELRHRQPELPDRQPRDAARVGRASIGLAVRRVRAAAAPAARVGGSRVLPSLVREFLRRGQPGVGPSDYDPWTYTTPQHADLPDGGGYPITLHAITAAAAARGAQNYHVRDRLRRRAHPGPGMAWTSS